MVKARRDGSQLTAFRPSNNCGLVAREACATKPVKEAT
jgi:hypothetical protein